MILSRMSSRPLKEQGIPTLKNSSGLCKRILETGEVHFFSRQSKTSIKQLKHERRYVRDKYCCGYKHVLLFTQKENYMNIVKSEIEKAFVGGMLFYDQKQVTKIWAY